MRLPARRAYHVIYDASLRDALAYAKEHNWTEIVPDLGVPRFFHTEYSEDDRAELRANSKTLNIEWGFHAPGDDVSFFTAYPPIRESILSYFREIIDFARSVSNGQTNIVVHCGKIPSYHKSPGYAPSFRQEHHEFYREVFYENLHSLIEYGGQDVSIVLENISWNPLVLEVIDDLVPKGLKLCLDIPKLFTHELHLIEADWRTFQKQKSAIEVVHLHDMSSKLKSHLIIGSGSIDFEEFLRFLSEIDRSLQYVMEVRPREAANESLQVFEELLEKFDVSLR
jgi:sugar phosphate isomerase/epimerase